MNYKQLSKTYSLTIGWLYPDLMSIYGDRGNIICLTKRCEWRGISVTILPITLETSHKQLAICDMLFMGGAQDSQQTIVAKDLKENKGKVLGKMINNGIAGLYICGAYQFLGKYYKEADGTIIEGLGIFDLYTENPGKDKKRLIGNVSATLPPTLSHLRRGKEKKAISFSPGEKALEEQDEGENTQTFSKLNLSTIVGFENHGGRTYLGKNIQPLAKIISGFGNNGEDKTEGAQYKNSFGSYFHGPILPKNPHFADYLIQLALKQKYGKEIELKQLDDNLAWKAHNQVFNRIR